MTMILRVVLHIPIKYHMDLFPKTVDIVNIRIEDSRKCAPNLPRYLVQEHPAIESIAVKY